MGSTKKQVTKLPKRAFTKPSVIAIVFFVIILLVLVPNTITLLTDKASVQALALIYLSPLVLPGFFCAYHTGLAMGKISYKKWHKGLFESFLATLLMQLICIALCIGIEIALTGYPIQMCFDTCQKIAIGDVITSYSVFSMVLFLPAYYALYRYDSWRRNFNN